MAYRNNVQDVTPTNTTEPSGQGPYEANVVDLTPIILPTTRTMSPMYCNPIPAEKNDAGPAQNRRQYKEEEKDEEAARNEINND
ncbi:hypothetical protein QBC43DRAFT_292048 [Cladorrhinum sp. PSN259]|nr:hypothetical protein QBC43DRAFT_292048 [Cladorrhinum sp. PSN259]